MITLSHPYTTPTTTVQARNAELGNSDTVDRKLIFRKSMSGDLHTHVGTLSPKRLVATFIITGTALEAALLSFIKTVRHDEFKYVDHDGISFKCRFPMSNYTLTGHGLHTRVLRIEMEVS
jgi:hypothetical protein